MRKQCLFSDTKTGMKQNVTKTVEEKTRKEKMAEKRKVMYNDKGIVITEK